MTTTTKQVLLTIAGGSIVPAIFWLGGYDFNSRGPEPVLCVLGTVIMAAWSWVGYHIFYD